MDAAGGTNKTNHDSTITTGGGQTGGYSVAAGMVLLLASLSLNVILAHRVWSFTHLQSNRVAERLLKVGTTVPAIRAIRLDGQPGVISYQSAEESTVLYVFTPPCSWCARNM